MALDFPSNPADGQIFGSYSWNASKSVWQAREESNTVAITSPEKPTTANPGDIWVNTTTGIAFVYYNDGNTSQWMELLSSAVPAVNEIMPLGTIVQTARSTAPTGWLLCQGQTISRTTYSGLFAAIGTTYGAGDGSTTFAIPNLRGRVVAGLDSAQDEFNFLGETGGAKTHTLTINEMPSHDHSQASHTHTFSGTVTGSGAHNHLFFMDDGAASPGGATRYSTVGYDATSNNTSGNGGWFWTPGSNSSYDGTHSHTYSGTTSQATPGISPTGGGLAHNNLQPYIVLNYMIKV